MRNLKVFINKNSHVTFNYEESDGYNWAYDGKAVIVEKDGKLVAVYSIEHIIGAISDDRR